MLAHFRHGDKKELADDMREVFKTGDKAYTLEDGAQARKYMCAKWGKHYRSIKKMADNEDGSSTLPILTMFLKYNQESMRPTDRALA